MVSFQSLLLNDPLELRAMQMLNSPHLDLWDDGAGVGVGLDIGAVVKVDVGAGVGAVIRTDIGAGVVLHLMRPSTNSSTTPERLPYVKFSRTLPSLLRSSMHVVSMDDGLGVTNTDCILVPVALMSFATEMTWFRQSVLQDWLELPSDLTVGSPSVRRMMIPALSKSIKVCIQSVNVS